MSSLASSFPPEGTRPSRMLLPYPSDSTLGRRVSEIVQFEGAYGRFGGPIPSRTSHFSSCDGHYLVRDAILSALHEMGQQKKESGARSDEAVSFVEALALKAATPPLIPGILREVFSGKLPFSEAENRQLAKAVLIKLAGACCEGKPFSCEPVVAFLKTLETTAVFFQKNNLRWVDECVEALSCEISPAQIYKFIAGISLRLSALQKLRRDDSEEAAMILCASFVKSLKSAFCESKLSELLATANLHRNREGLHRCLEFCRDIKSARLWKETLKVVSESTFEDIRINACILWLDRGAQTPESEDRTLVWRVAEKLLLRDLLPQLQKKLKTRCESDVLEALKTLHVFAVNSTSQAMVEAVQQVIFHQLGKTWMPESVEKACIRLAEVLAGKAKEKVLAIDYAELVRVFAKRAAVVQQHQSTISRPERVNPAADVTVTLALAGLLTIPTAKLKGKEVERRRAEFFRHLAEAVTLCSAKRLETYVESNTSKSVTDAIGAMSTAVLLESNAITFLTALAHNLMDADAVYRHKTIRWICQHWKFLSEDRRILAELSPKMTKYLISAFPHEIGEDAAAIREHYVDSCLELSATFSSGTCLRGDKKELRHPLEIMIDVLCEQSRNVKTHWLPIATALCEIILAEKTKDHCLRLGLTRRVLESLTGPRSGSETVLMNKQLVDAWMKVHRTVEFMPLLKTILQDKDKLANALALDFSVIFYRLWSIRQLFEQEQSQKELTPSKIQLRTDKIRDGLRELKFDLTTFLLFGSLPIHFKNHLWTEVFNFTLELHGKFPLEELAHFRRALIEFIDTMALSAIKRVDGVALIDGDHLALLYLAFEGALSKIVEALNASPHLIGFVIDDVLHMFVRKFAFQGLDPEKMGELLNLAVRLVLDSRALSKTQVDQLLAMSSHATSGDRSDVFLELEGASRQVPVVLRGEVSRTRTPAGLIEWRKQGILQLFALINSIEWTAPGCGQMILKLASRILYWGDMTVLRHEANAREFEQIYAQLLARVNEVDPVELFNLDFFVDLFSSIVTPHKDHDKQRQGVEVAAAKGLESCDRLHAGVLRNIFDSFCSLCERVIPDMREGTRIPPATTRETILSAFSYLTVAHGLGLIKYEDLLHFFRRLFNVIISSKINVDHQDLVAVTRAFAVIPEGEFNAFNPDQKRLFADTLVKWMQVLSNSQVKSDPLDFLKHWKSGGTRAFEMIFAHDDALCRQARALHQEILSKVS